jgi:serine protease
MNFLRRPPRAWRAALAGATLAASCLVPLAGAAAASGPAHGLIVRLKDAPSHAGDRADDGTSPRWRGVIRDSALGARSGRAEPLLRAVGRDQQLLHFGRVLPPDEAQRIAQRLRQHPDVAWVEPNTRERRLQVSNDPLAAQQWWLKPAGGSNANAIGERLRGVPGFLSAWQSGTPGARGVPAAVVAVLDTGITAHPDLAGRTLAGMDFVSETHFAGDGNGRDADPADPGDWVSASDRSDPLFAGCDEQKSSWHGTVIAGLLAAVTGNGVGVAGINQQGRVLPVRVAGKCGADVADIIDGMRWAAGLSVAGVPANPNPARIINISFGGSAACGAAYQSAIDEIRRFGAGGLGTLVVAAAGNEHGAVSRPASCSGVVGVVALNRDGFKTHYSNFGSVLSASGLATVGGDDAQGGLWSALADGGLVTVWNSGRTSPGDPDYAGLYGTSFAAPLVAGTASLMLSVNPALSVDQLVAGLRLGARPHVTSPHISACSDANPGRCICSTATCGAGILDADQALRYAAHPESYVSPVRQAEVIDNIDVTRAAALGADRPPNTPAVSPPGDGGGGGGASSAAWVAGLLLAVAALSALRRRRV